MSIETLRQPLKVTVSQPLSMRRRIKNHVATILFISSFGVALMPLVVSYPGASWISDAVGVLGGAVVGLPLALTQDGFSAR